MKIEFNLAVVECRIDTKDYPAGHFDSMDNLDKLAYDVIRADFRTVLFNTIYQFEKDQAAKGRFFSIKTK